MTQRKASKHPINWITLTPNDFEFDMFGGTDEIKTRIKSSTAEGLAKYLLEYKNSWDTNVHFEFRWTYIHVDGIQIPRLYHLMALEQALNLVKVEYTKVNTKQLLYAYVIMPYIYGQQQDKHIELENRVTDLYLLNKLEDIHLFYSVISPHSTGVLQNSDARGITYNKQWTDIISDMYPESSTLYVYPDKSAKSRFPKDTKTKENNIVLNKVRKDGVVVDGSMRVAMTYLPTLDLKDVENVVFMDDMIMGGKTFIQGKEVLLKQYPELENVKSWVIAAPHIQWNIYHKVFTSFDQVITVDFNYDKRMATSQKLVLVDLEEIWPEHK